MKNLFLLSFITLSILNSCKNETVKFRNNIENSGYYSSHVAIANPATKWKFKTNGKVHASAVFDENRVYIGSEDSSFYSLDALSGNLNWKFKTGGKIFSTALVNGNYVYFVSYDGFIYKLNKNNGRLIWKYKTSGEQTHHIKNYYDLTEFVPDFWDFYQSSPTIFDNKIYAGCGNYYYAIDDQTGEMLWKFKTDGVVHSSAAAKDNKIVFGSYDSRIYCLDANTGEKIWSYETGRDTAQYVWIGIDASPLIDNEKVYIGSRDANIYCLNLNSGDTIWTNNDFNRSWMPSSFANGDSKIYCGSSDGFSFYGINKSNGKIDYSVKTNSYTFSSPAITDSMAFIGSANGRLYAINLNREKIQWEYETFGSLSDTLRVYKNDGTMDLDRLKDMMISMDINKYEKLVQFYDMMFRSTGAIVSSPVVHNGIIYFGSCDGYVYAVSDK